MNNIELLKACTVCPSQCKVDRTTNIFGKCKSGLMPIVSSYSPHFGEEPVLSGRKGVGNIFFGNCNLHCVYCQNYLISQNYKLENNNEVSIERLADIMLELQDKGCHNIGLVSPTHFSPQILEAIILAKNKGLILPIIYNSNGYDSVSTLKLFDGLVDIYLPDFKYGNDSYAKEYSGIDNYFTIAKEAITEMYKQVGSDLIFKKDLVVRGLIIRHLVLPNGLSESENIFRFIANELDKKVHISLMAQYFPSYKADEHILVSRKLRRSEYEKAITLMENYGLTNGWIQELESSENYLPNFEQRDNPFNNNITSG